MFQALFFKRLFLSLLLTLTTINAYSASVPAQSPGQIKKNWLEAMFFPITNCDPSVEFRFDQKNKSSKNEFLEKKGYKIDRIVGDFAYYKIKENFFGLHATELMIPNERVTYDVIHVVSFKENPSITEKKIKNNTGENIKIYPRKTEKKHGTVYLYPEKNGNSSLVCDNTEPEGGL
jgi:hypothetical protein